MIEMRNVSKRYPNGVTAISDLSVNINPGEFVYIVGPSGAGKSTFIKMMYCDERLTSGDIKVGKFDLSTIKQRELPHLRRYVGVVFQDFKLLEKKTVYENIAYAMEVIGKRPSVIRKRVLEVLDLVGLKHKVRMFPNELSGGEQQRIAIARAIANMPGVLIADEPTGNLDPDTALEIMNILERISANGTTVIMATHSRSIVNNIKHRVLAIENGRLVRDEQEGEYGYDD
ncbi:cell division ATP-binding protein FtsE [Granulicatella sp. zg-ZJ]|uniref:cell division ATP-binding protein FtsE n=1 Tax=unclassified Granulicatella TaxID=2630493 RepID=UPI0013C13A21|nr:MULTISPECIES: cell division ATP-binding protein FtsE [unclassified Granulicatella]MBS4750759.1 cell division ATP-binding protein FtsE [Carnobacteriaceae bacterium zg-ZUI78]NEW62589.1 cell division ATP-binding protein FtsE [Granulicatella sp. zg-ZJ]NEW66694.1 cell division ATP-binding protein FtsE [Granulicatella sp. zg-84]QMI85989.1 cell division ATP-binding protein FtsE [Carnobacteriaceae bacterium zg-84]